MLRRPINTRLFRLIIGAVGVTTSLFFYSSICHYNNYQTHQRDLIHYNQKLQHLLSYKPSLSFENTQCLCQYNNEMQDIWSNLLKQEEPFNLENLIATLPVSIHPSVASSTDKSSSQICFTGYTHHLRRLIETLLTSTSTHQIQSIQISPLLPAPTLESLHEPYLSLITLTLTNPTTN